MKNSKARNFGFLLYPDSIPKDGKEKLESFGASLSVSPLNDIDEKIENLKDNDCNKDR